MERTKILVSKNGNFFIVAPSDVQDLSIKMLMKQEPVPESVCIYNDMLNGTYKFEEMGDEGVLKERIEALKKASSSVDKTEFDKLKTEMDELKQTIQAMKTEIEKLKVNCLFQKEELVKIGKTFLPKALFATAAKTYGLTSMKGLTYLFEVKFGKNYFRDRTWGSFTSEQQEENTNILRYYYQVANFKPDPADPNLEAHDSRFEEAGFLEFKKKFSNNLRSKKSYIKKNSTKKRSREDEDDEEGNGTKRTNTESVEN